MECKDDEAKIDGGGDMGYEETVSVIIPIKDCAPFLDQCFESILNQDFPHELLEISIHDDRSTDGSTEIISKWCNVFSSKGIRVLSTRNNQATGGCAYAKNVCVKQSTGKYLCFQDADDYMTADRIRMQLQACKSHPTSIVGSNFFREGDATPRFTDWYNRLTEEQLMLQQYRECTVAMPTWFCTREVYTRVGGFVESVAHTPEDLIFFHKHLDLGGKLFKVDKALVMYRYHTSSTSHNIHRLSLMKIRMEAFEKRVLSKWSSFTIWGAGRDGRKFFVCLSAENKKKVASFCDVDVNKVGNTYINKEYKIPIVHFTKAKPPLVICVALDRTQGQLEQNVASLNLKEGEDYYHFN